MLSQAAFFLPLNTRSSLIEMLANLDSNSTPILKARGSNLLKKDLNQSIDRSQSINQSVKDQSTNPSIHRSINQRFIQSLRGSDCKYRESADKLRKSKILITCQKNTFWELSSKILLKPSGILLFSGNSEKRFCLIYYAIIRLKIKQIENACFKTVCNARKQF